MALMAHHPAVSLGLSNLARRGQVAAAHWHISRHLPPEGARLTVLAQRAGMSKQAMGTLVRQCEAWGMVQCLPDAHDARAHRLFYADGPGLAECLCGQCGAGRGRVARRHWR